MPRWLAFTSVLTAVGTFVMWPTPPSGRLVKVYGDLAAADRVAIIVPGADTTVATFEAGTKRPGGAAKALLAEAARLAPGERLAVVAWLGYDSPPTLSVGAITHDAAVAGAAELRRTITELRTRTAAPVALLCHSYGSVLCGKAAPGLPIADLVVFGSPGLDAPSATVLSSPHRSSASSSARSFRVWAGLGANDWIRYVPKTKIGPLGFGHDPMSSDYGARVFEVGPGGHSDYFTPGTPSLRNLTMIALGHPDQVTP